MNRSTIIAAFFALVFLGGQCALAQSGYNLFQKGLIQERVKGDLDEAIKIYERIIIKFPEDRPIVAKALLHIGLCYEKMGKQEAQKAYQRLIKEYADQHEPVAQARARLAALRTDPSGMTLRRVWTYNGRYVDIDGTVSPDGRYLPFEDYVTGDLVVRDLATGENRRLTHNKIPQEPGQVSSEQISPDSTQVAYSWWQKQDGSTDLRLIGLDGSRPRVIYRHEEVSRIVPKGGGWSPDGKHILVNLERKDGTVQIAFISVADGSLQVLKSLGQRVRNSFPFLSPDGRYIAYEFHQNDDSLREDIYVLAVDGSSDIPLVAHPADDDVLGWSPDGKSVLFRSDRTGTDGLWAIGVHEGKPKGSPQLVNKDLEPFKGLGITRAGAFYYTTSGVADTQDIYIATLDPATGKVLGPPKPIPARFVGNNVSPAWSPDGEYLAYYRLPGGGDRGIMVIRSLETGEERELSPPIAELPGPRAPMRWSPDGHSILRIGRHESKEGIYLVDVETGNFTPIVEMPRGAGISHALWSPDGKAIFYRCWGKNGDQVLVRNLENDKETELLRGEGSASISRGFALSPDGRQLVFGSPWFPGKGVTALHVIPTAGGERRELLREQDSEDLTRFGMNIRSAWYEWTPDGRYVLFFRADGAKVECWRVAAEGGEPERLELEFTTMPEVCIAPDGRRVAFTARKRTTMDEVWVMENFLPESKARE